MEFEIFRGKRIFLTGGTGFFGKSILDMLLKGFLPDTEFVILSRDPAKFLADEPQYAGLKNVSFVAGDVRDFGFPEGDFDYIIHAATPAVTTLAPGEMRSIILGGMHRVLDFARKCRSPRLLFTSSGAVYGIQEPECLNITEDHPCQPLTEYGIAKLEAENLCRYSCVDVLVARCFAFVGPRLNRNIHFAIGNFIRDALAGKEITVNGDGTPLRSYLYADDLVRWLFNLLGSGSCGKAYNVGSDQAVSIAALARKVAALIAPDRGVRIMQTPAPDAQGQPYVPDVNLSRLEKLSSETVTLDEAIRLSAGIYRC